MSGRMEGEYEGVRYRISFKYGHWDSRTEQTLANVERFIDGQWTVLCGGLATRSEKDKHVREVARKVALARGLMSCPQKPFRTFIWGLYQGRKAKNGGAA